MINSERTVVFIRMGNNTIGHAERVRLAATARVCIPTVGKAIRGEPIRGDAGTRIHAALTEFEEGRALAAQRAADLAELTRSRVDAACKKYGLVPTSLKLQVGPVYLRDFLAGKTILGVAYGTICRNLSALDERDGDVATGDVADEAGKDR
jgi:hypothetical protein